MRRSIARTLGVLILTAGLASGLARAAAEPEPAPPSASPSPLAAPEASPAGSPAPVEAAPTPEEEVAAALERPVVFDRDRLPAKEALDRIAKATGLLITLDPKVGARAEAAETALAAAGELPARRALGLLLRQLGLRYAVEGKTLYVSTEERLAARLRAREGAVAPEVPEEEPLTSDELNLRRYRDEAFESGATVPSMGFSTDTYYLSPTAPLGIAAFGPFPYDPADVYAYDPGQWPVRPYYDAAAGLWNYPAPPIWGRPLRYSIDRRAAYFTSQPSFVHPGYRGIVPQIYSDAVTSYWPAPLVPAAGTVGIAVPAAPAAPGEAAEAAAESVAVAREILLERVRAALAKNPDLTAQELLELLKKE